MVLALGSLGPCYDCARLVTQDNPKLTVLETSRFIEAMESNAPRLVAEWWTRYRHLFGMVPGDEDYDVDESWRVVLLLKSIAVWQPNSKDYQ